MDMADTDVNDTPQAERKFPSGFHGKKGRSGPPKGNTNAARHFLSAGKLPKKMAYIENRVNALRRQLESLVLDNKQSINVTDAACINTAMKWERHAALAQHYLRHESDKLSPMERLKFSEAIAKASDSRDKSIERLKLDREADPWAQLYEKPKLIEHVPADDDIAAELGDK